jgi:hypothetical protein
MIDPVPMTPRPLRLLGVPIPLMRASAAEGDAMLAAAEDAVGREGAGPAGVTSSLASVVRALTDEYADLSSVTSSEVDRAEAAGEERVDLEMDVPITMASAAETWLRLMEHLDDLAALRQFEHEPSSKDVVEFRRWLVGEITGQLREGRAPQRF